ncbi:hypothetical protein [Streptomyces sp. NPDC048560]|uniref:DUF6892 domain-containing protein n=1 Tax=Streptomyces sp. NPDC048560 TaxID=3155488 RepID=UPI00342ED807
MTTANPLRELPDTNLHLAVLSRLMDMGTVPPFQVPAPEGAHECGDDCDDTCTDWLDRPWEFEYRKDVADALLGLPVTTEQCATLSRVRWDTSSRAIAMIWSEWGGECDEFNVRSLDGIAIALPALESLHLELTEVTDLTPLAHCGRLCMLSLAGRYDDETNLNPLSRADSLRTLVLTSKLVEDLSPLASLPLENITLDGCHDSNYRNIIDLAPLERMSSLRTLDYRRYGRIAGDEHPVLSAFDNARVIKSLRERGVALAFE